MKNQNLIVEHQAAGAVDFATFKTCAEMTRWEFAAYDAYGQTTRCGLDEIETLADLFGAVFQAAFNRRKNVLFAELSLANLALRKACVEQDIANWNKVLANPPSTDIDDVLHKFNIAVCYEP